MSTPTLTLPNDLLLERRNRLARTLGEAPERVTTERRMELRALRENGTLVRVRVFGISMFYQRATYQEWGVDKTTDTRGARLKPGAKSLFPRELIAPLESMESRVRANLERHSFDLEGFAPWRYVPLSAYAAFKAEHERILAGYEMRGRTISGIDTLVSTILANYEAIREQNRADFADMARRALRSLRANNTHADVLEESYVQGVVDQALAQMPTPEQIQQGVRVAYELAPIIDREEIALAQTEQELQRLRAQAEREGMTEAMRRVQALRQDEFDAMRRQVQEVASPFAQVFEQLDSRIYEDVQEILEVVRRNGFLPGRTAERARGIPELYRLLNCMQSRPELEAAIQTLEQSLAATGVHRRAGDRTYNDQAVTSALQQIATITHQGTQAALAERITSLDMIDLDD